MEEHFLLTFPSQTNPLIKFSQNYRVYTCLYQDNLLVDTGSYIPYREITLTIQIKS
jgi:hypothetical protein